ncbi:MAG: hypothetical protein DELT_02627 [Desulfovibrio sp.]
MSTHKHRGWGKLTAALFEERFGRIQQATGARTQVELANRLDIAQSSVSDAKRRLRIPPEWVLKLMESYRVNPNWIKCGEEPMLIPEGDPGVISTVISDPHLDLETFLLELILKVSPSELEEEIQTAFCMSGRCLNPSDSFTDILKMVLPDALAMRICDHIAHLSGLPGKDSSDSNESTE